MAYTKLNSRENLTDYCLRRLGYPVVEINVSDDQIDDRVDDALQMYFEYHSDGSHNLRIPLKITQYQIDRGRIDFDDIKADVANELTANPLWGTLSDRIISVVQVFSINDSTSATNFMDFKYQMRLNDVADLSSGVGEMVYFEQMQQHLSMVDMKLTGSPQIIYLRRENVLFIEGDLKAGTRGDLKAGDYIMIDLFLAQRDDGSASTFYDDIFLKEFATALIKRQWGENLSKFDGVTLPGGVTINGQRMIEEANTEVEQIRQRVQLEYDTPPSFFIG
jgi:hypothetical protein|tara:strand:+ start:1340 stop:2170 length:831 start_codon:yes stop_codon:yes gene_type:complete